MKEKVVVTGGAGFIGSHLVTQLVEDGYAVTVVDNLSTARKDTLAAVADKIVFIEADICDQAALEAACAGAKYVFHVAAIPGVPVSLLDPEGTHRVNALGTQTVMNAAAAVGVSRVVFSSSAAVYGNTESVPTAETVPPAPISPYGAQKLEAEGYVLGGKTEGVVLRYFNVFGERQNPSSQYAAVIPLFIRLMREGKSPMINGDGATTRDYAYVRNIVDANIRAATTPAAAGTICNIACGSEISLLDLVAAINAALGTAIEPVYGPFREGDIRRSCADISQARDILGYKPLVSFEDGIRRTISSL